MELSDKNITNYMKSLLTIVSQFGDIAKMRVIGIVFMLIMAPAFAFSQDCKVLFRNANELLNSGKYDEAINVYQQVLDCGDKNHAEDCKYLIQWIKDNRPSKNKSKASGFNLSLEEVTIPSQGGEYTVQVGGSGKWTYTINSDWCTAKREGNSIVISCINENESLTPRTAKIDVESESQRKTIIVTNLGARETLRSSANKLTFPPSGERNKIEVVSNNDWGIKEIKKNPESNWIDVQKIGSTVTFTVEANNENKQREADIRLVTPSNLTTIIKIYQGGAAINENISFSKNDLEFDKEGGDDIVKVYTDAQEWKFGSFPSWVQLTRIGKDSIRIHCAPNDPIGEIREGSINITTGNQSLGINVSQAAKPFIPILPVSGIGGRALSFGVSAGYLMPMISTSADGFKGSIVNYASGNNKEDASYSAGAGFTLGVFADIRIYRNFYLIAGVNYLQYSYDNKFNANVDRKIYKTERYYQAGSTQNQYEEEYKMSQLEIPLLVSYRLPVKINTSHVQFNLGPVINYGLSAKMKINGYTSSESTYYYAIENGQMTGEKYDNSIQSIHDKGSGEFDLYGKNVTYSIVDKDGQTFNKSTAVEDSPLKRLNIGACLGVAYEYKGISLGVEYTYMFTNMANDKYWNGKRWPIFDQLSDTQMSGYKQNNHYLGIKLGYTFRY